MNLQNGLFALGWEFRDISAYCALKIPHLYMTVLKTDMQQSGGGGGGLLTHVCILGMCRARDPHFQPWISIPEHIVFTKFYQKIRSGASPFFFFAVLETIIFKISLISTRSLPPTAGSALRVSGRSGDTHFHVQNGSSSFRRYAFSRSKRINLVPEPHIFTLDRELVPEPLPIFHFAAAQYAYQNLGWVPTPPSPGQQYVSSTRKYLIYEDLKWFTMIYLGTGLADLNHFDLNPDLCVMEKMSMEFCVLCLKTIQKVKIIANWILFAQEVTWKLKIKLMIYFVGIFMPT